jgi:NAD(P)-dependent dehydrogenase (short-subunit alcohol dehydrogenase family)
MTDRITTPFNAESTAAEVISGIDLTGQRAIVTGGASGIGIETARALASANADVTLAVRNTAAGEQVAADITESTGNSRVLVTPLDLVDQASVAAFVAAWDGPLHILINNAGIMASPLMRTPQGWEMQFATNHLGHFALATGLHPALAAASGARIVSVSSSAHHRSPVVFDDIHFLRRPYDPWSAYGQSKTANVLFAVAATKRWGADGITANALMPGGIRTNLQRYVPEEELARRRAAAGVEDQCARAGRGHVGARRNIPSPGRRGRAVLRRLQRGGRRAIERAPRRRRVRPRSGSGRAAVAGVGRNARRRRRIPRGTVATQVRRVRRR